MSFQRIRDPLHNIIEFDDTELERTLWRVVQSKPFQRLRRIKQLGFSDLVYPGATHSRFAHSLGVFHTARQLMEVVRQKTAKEDTREQRALAAALVHDLGHGAFSHAFETVGRRLDLKMADHELVSDLLIRDGEVAYILNDALGSGFAADVADIIKKQGKITVHNAVVSSQFDADRLDYMRRDRLMTGTQHAAIDFDWLVNNLEIGSLATGVDETPIGNVETFVIGPKAIHATEAYILGLFQLYPTVYFHKATRGAEQIFSELLIQIVTLSKNGSVSSTGLTSNHPLIKFAKNPDKLENAVALDDTVVWGALPLLESAKDPLIASFAERLRHRRLYKCKDIRTHISHALDPDCTFEPELMKKIETCCATTEEKITDWMGSNQGNCPRILIDKAKRSPYKEVSGSAGLTERINVRTEGGELVDLNQRSRVVANMTDFVLFRVYYGDSDSDAQETIEKIIDGEVETCR